MNNLTQIQTGSIYQHEDGHFSVYSDIIIDAPKEAVWRVLLDFDRMKEWSSTIVNITGENVSLHGLILAQIAFDSYPKFNRELAQRVMTKV
mgnify:CR=1 FL=1